MGIFLPWIFWMKSYCLRQQLQLLTGRTIFYCHEGKRHQHFLYIQSSFHLQMIKYFHITCCVTSEVLCTWSQGEKCFIISTKRICYIHWFIYLQLIIVSFNNFASLRILLVVTTYITWIQLSFHKTCTHIRGFLWIKTLNT